MKTIKVSSCSDCPFYEFQDEMRDSICRADETVHMDSSYHDNVAWFRVHNNCPLKSSPIKVAVNVVIEGSKNEDSNRQK